MSGTGPNGMNPTEMAGAAAAMVAQAGIPPTADNMNRAMMAIMQGQSAMPSASPALPGVERTMGAPTPPRRAAQRTGAVSNAPAPQGNGNTPTPDVRVNAGAGGLGPNTMPGNMTMPDTGAAATPDLMAGADQAAQDVAVQQMQGNGNGMAVNEGDAMTALMMMGAAGGVPNMLRQAPGVIGNMLSPSATRPAPSMPPAAAPVAPMVTRADPATAAQMATMAGGSRQSQGVGPRGAPGPRRGNPSETERGPKQNLRETLATQRSGGVRTDVQR